MFDYVLFAMRAGKDSSAGFSLRGFVPAWTKTRRLKPALLKTKARLSTREPGFFILFQFFSISVWEEAPQARVQPAATALS